jgi:hypothetical protein
MSVFVSASVCVSVCVNVLCVCVPTCEVHGPNHACHTSQPHTETEDAQVSELPFSKSLT